jgi:aspartate 4-decarboxylase
MDEKKVYQKASMEIVQRRFKALIDSLGLQLSPNANFDGYYALIDFEFWARKNIGDDAVEYLKKNVHPLDLAFRLAEDHGIVLLNGGGFEAPQWSLRVSLANLPDEAYEDIGRGVRAIARGYRQMFEAHEAGRNGGSPKPTLTDPSDEGPRCWPGSRSSSSAIPSSRCSW